MLTGTAAAARSAPQIEDVAAETSASTATVTWKTSLPTQARVVYGVGGLYLYSARESSPVTEHAAVLPDLAPSTTYAFEIVASAATANGTLTTSATPPDRRFGVAGTHVTENGSLFFPVLSYYQCGASATAAASLGINLFMQAPYTGCMSTNPNDFSNEPPPPSVSVLSDDYTVTGAGDAGWYLPDEPDGWGITPAELPQLPPASESGKLRVLNVSQHFYSAQAPINDHFDRNDYKRYASLADLVGFDMYPIVKFCGRVPLLKICSGRNGADDDLSRPACRTFRWIRARADDRANLSVEMQVTPQTVNTEDVARDGGRACSIGYFTNSWTGELLEPLPVCQLVQAQLVGRSRRFAALHRCFAASTAT